MLSRRWLINFALLAVIAALLWVGLRVEDASVEAPGQRLSALRPADIDRIAVEAPGLSMTLRREASGWRIRQPVEWPAHADNVERLLSILRQQATAIATADDVDLAALGLQPPVATLFFDDLRLDFGAVNPVGQRRYLRLGEDLYLLPDVHLAFATQGLPGMVDRRLLPGLDTIKRLALPGIEITSDSEGVYRSADRPGLAGDELARLVGNWKSLPATGIRPFDLDAMPGQLISVRLASDDEIDFLLQSSEPEIIIANPRIGLQYHFRSDYRDQLIAPGSDG